MTPNPDPALSMTDAASWPAVGRFLVGGLVLFVINRTYDYRVSGYIANSLLFAMKLLTLLVLQIEPFDPLIIVKIFSVLPFLYILHYHRHDAPKRVGFGKFLIVILGVNIAEPALLKEFKQGIYLNAVTGLFMAVYTVYPGCLGTVVTNEGCSTTGTTGTVIAGKQKSDPKVDMDEASEPSSTWAKICSSGPVFVAPNLGWGWVLSYTIWHTCVFYGQTYDLSNPNLVVVGNYFVFDTALCLFPLVPCFLSPSQGPEKWIQTRAHSLGIKLAFNFLWTSDTMPEWWVANFYADIQYSPYLHFWFQVLAFGVVVVSFLITVVNYRKRVRLSPVSIIPAESGRQIKADAFADGALAQ